jgi:hypothetical protein
MVYRTRQVQRRIRSVCQESLREQQEKKFVIENNSNDRPIITYQGWN